MEEEDGIRGAKESGGVGELYKRQIMPRAEAGVAVIEGRWVDVNKGDDARANYRCRYVAKEF